MLHRTDSEMLHEITRDPEFSRKVYEDRLDDWGIGRQLGEYILRNTDTKFLGHFLLAKSARHQGDIENARRSIQHAFDSAATEVGITEAEIRYLQAELDALSEPSEETAKE